ncbi:MAG: hypothetical protein Q9217_003392 [Psora testacea]
MTCPQPNPRRGYKTGVPPISTLLHSPTNHHARSYNTTIDSDRALRKSATFHSPKSPASEDDPIVNIPLLSRRSPTSPRDLEDAVAAGEERIAKLLGSVDRSLSGLETFASDSQETIRPDEHPIPRFMLGTNVNDQEDHMDIDRSGDHTTHSKNQPRRKHHTSDSGIGSTVTDPDYIECRDDAAHALAEYKHSIPSVISHIQSGINGANQSDEQHALSAYACRQIQKYLIVPILQEETLKNFHPLVTGIPIRVGRKEITCLRDLEKVLLWLAPRFSESRSSFISFCERSIQCLHTTVEYLNESDQRRPSDRPYTNGYFLDLTEQVRQYAAMISAARERMATGRAQPGDEETTNSKVSLEGGIGQTGRPAELVRTSNGRSVSLRTGEEVDLDAQQATRSNSQGMDEDVLLSMARRRKAAAEKVVQRCSECDKEFKRPCDLTKHEKTHTRPWKCNEPTCKYSHYGWPTEKERDRHVNDKHSMTPSMFKCQFHPCPYESKRESNCKQHMEKAHGWAYVRSKNNGKVGKKAKTSSKSSPTPQMTTPGSYIFEASGSEFGDSSASPYMRSLSSGGQTANGSIAATSPYLSMNEAYSPSPFEPNLTWNQQHPTLTPQSPFTPASHRLSLDATSAANDAVLPSSYETSLAELDVPLFNNTFDWSNMDTNFQSMNIQLFTPATSIGSRPVDAYHSRNPSVSLEKPTCSNLKLSPGAEGGLMLYSPHDAVADEGFDEFTEMGKPTSDFALFDDTRPDAMGNGSMSLFQDLPPFQSQTWSGQQFDTNIMEE